MHGFIRKSRSPRFPPEERLERFALVTPSGTPKPEFFESESDATGENRNREKTGIETILSGITSEFVEDV